MRLDEPCEHGRKNCYCHARERARIERKIVWVNYQAHIAGFCNYLSGGECNCKDSVANS